MTQSTSLDDPPSTLSFPVLDVIYIAGQGRSGSTVLDRVLGAVPGVTSFNELRPVWEYGFIDNNTCSCGERFSTCPFWTDVMQRAFDGHPDHSRLIDECAQVDHTRRIPQLLTGGGDAAFRRSLAQYREALRALYLALAAKTGTSILVDSSKVPARALVLSGIPGFRVHVLHMVRDARAVAYAWWKRAKKDPRTGGQIQSFRPARSAAFWLSRNLASELLRLRLPYLRVHYEDFVKSPRDEVQRIIDTLDPLKGRRAPFIDARRIVLPTLHSISGNPGRFNTGVTSIDPEMEWVDRLPLRERLTVTVATAPLLARYGYLGRRRPSAMAIGPAPVS